MPHQENGKLRMKLTVTAKFRHGTRHPTFLKAKLKPKVRRSTNKKKTKQKKAKSFVVTARHDEDSGSNSSTGVENTVCQHTLTKTQSSKTYRQNVEVSNPTRSAVVGMGECLTLPPFYIKSFTTDKSEYPKFATLENDDIDNDQESDSEEEPLYHRFKTTFAPTETIIVDPEIVPKKSVQQKKLLQNASLSGNDDAVAFTPMQVDQDTVTDEKNIGPTCESLKQADSYTLKETMPTKPAECSQQLQLEMEQAATLQELLNTATGSEWEDISTSDEMLKDVTSCDTETMLLGEKFSILFPKDDCFTVLLEHPVMLSVIGKIQVKVLHGCLDVLGYRLTPQHSFAPIYSPQTNSHIVIATCPTNLGGTYLMDLDFERDKLWQELLMAGYLEEEACLILRNFNNNIVILQCKELPNVACSYVKRYYPKLFQIHKQSLNVANVDLENRYGCAFGSSQETKSIAIEDHWRQITTDIGVIAQNKASSPRIIICGGKGVGKSTMSRYLLNSLLNVCNKVCYMDCDPGQSEFTPPGLVSLLEVLHPCLGPAFTHHQKPKIAFFIGGTSVGEAPNHYIKCIHEMWKYYMHHDLKHKPLLVNTMGWNKGLGVALLVDLISIIQPTHVIQLNSILYRGRNFPLLSPEYVKNLSGWATDFADVQLAYTNYIVQTKIKSDDKSDYTPMALRQINILAYLSTLQTHPSIKEFQPLNCLNSHKIPWSSVAIHVCHAKVANSEILYVLNTSIVAMCKCDPKELISTVDPTLPKFLSKVPVCHCLGYGIVRGISMEEKCFYVLTSISPEELFTVNVLLRGAIDLPKQLLLEQNVDVPIPYLMTKQTTSYLHIGHKTVMPRNFKLKRTAYLSC